MFTPLIEGLRGIRVQLTNGYVIFFWVWLLFGDWDNAAIDDDPFGSRLELLQSWLGDGPSFTLLTFAAVLLGGIVERWFARDGRERVAASLAVFSWVWLESRAREEPQVATVRLQRAESDFRLDLAIVSTITALLLALDWTFTQQWPMFLWWFLLTVPVLIWIDWFAIQSSALTSLKLELEEYQAVRDEQIRDLEEETKQLRRVAVGKLKKIENSPRNGSPTHAPDELSAFKHDIAEIEETIDRKKARIVEMEDQIDGLGMDLEDLEKRVSQPVIRNKWLRPTLLSSKNGVSKFDWRYGSFVAVTAHVFVASVATAVAAFASGSWFAAVVAVFFFLTLGIHAWGAERCGPGFECIPTGAAGVDGAVGVVVGDEVVDLVGGVEDGGDRSN